MSRFDDLVGIDLFREAFLVMGKGQVRPTVEGRLRGCPTCELVKEVQHFRTVAQCASWVIDGRRYWAALCVGCGRLERDKRQAAERRADVAEEVREQRPQIGMRRPGAPSAVRHSMNGGG